VNLALVRCRCPAEQLLVAIKQRDIDAVFRKGQRYATTLKSSTQYADTHDYL